MNYRKVILGIVCAAAAVYAGGAEIKIVEHPDISLKGDDEVEHREIRLKSIFGINEEMLADTNRFPVSSARWHEVDLPEAVGGFKTAKFSLTDNGGKFGIFTVEMHNVLSAEADDNDLRREFKSAVDMVGKLLGVELKCPELRDIDEWRGHWRRIACDPGLPLLLGSDLHVEVADGYSVNIEAKDATYAKRNGKLQIVKNATVEVEVRSNGANPVPGRMFISGKKKKPVAIAREIVFGADLSGPLSEAVKDAAEERNGARSGAFRIKNLVRKAESGDVRAMNMLTWSYRFGHGVKADQNQAFKYCKMAADVGDARGVADLACCYEEGRGTKKDVGKAAVLWKKSAEMGNVWAVSRYAKCLAEGIGVEQDPKEAARLFAMCASSKSPEPWTMVQIASFYLRGFGVEKDEAKAREWLDKLEARAEDGDHGAIHVLAKFYLDGEKGVGKDAARAFKIAQLAEKTDTPWGYKVIAQCYKDGIGVERNAAKARAYVEKGLSKCKNGNCDLDALKKMQKELEDKQ